MTQMDNYTVPNVRCERYFIVESRLLCPECNVVTAVFAFALPAHYESLNVAAEDLGGERGIWEVPGRAAVLSYVEFLSAAVARRVRALTTQYRFELESEDGRPLWINHCEECGAPIPEEDLHGDMDGPFGPMREAGLDAIQLYDVREPFRAWVGRESHNLVRLDS